MRPLRLGERLDASSFFQKPAGVEVSGKSSQRFGRQGCAEPFFYPRQNDVERCLLPSNCRVMNSSASQKPEELPGLRVLHNEEPPRAVLLQANVKSARSFGKAESIASADGCRRTLIRPRSMLPRPTFLRSPETHHQAKCSTPPTVEPRLNRASGAGAWAGPPSFT